MNPIALRRMFFAAPAVVLLCSLALADDFTLRGKVIDLQDKPVAEAVIHACRYDMTQGKYVVAGDAQSNADGAFEFANLLSAPPKDSISGNFSLFVSKTGLSWGTGYARFTSGKFADITIRLAPPGAVSGRVVNKQGAPVAEAMVFVSAFLQSQSSSKVQVIGGRGAPIASAKTDKDGSFKFDALPTGARCLFLVEAAGYAINWSQVTEPSKETVPSEKVVVELAPEGRIICVLTDDKTGKPKAGVPIIFQSERGSSRNPAVTDDQGRFSAGGLAAGAYEPMTPAYGVDPGGVIAPVAPINVAEGQTVEIVSLKWTEGVLVEGAVQDAASKQPLFEAGVTLNRSDDSSRRRSYSGVTDAAGLFNIRVYPAAYNVEVNKESYLRGYAGPLIIPAQASFHVADIHMTPLASYKLTFVDVAGKPVPRATITRWSQIVATADDAGLLDFRPQQEIQWQYERLKACSPDGSLVAALDSSVVGAKQSTVVLKPSGSITGVVKDTAGAPLPGAKVIAYSRTQNQMSPEGEGLKTDADGMYKLTGLIADQNYTVQASAEGYGQNNAWNAPPLVLAAGASVEFPEIELPSAHAVLNGRLVDSTGAPVAGRTIQISGQQNQSKNVVTDKDGRFKVSNLVAESLYLYIMPASGADEHIQRRVEPGEFDNLLITLAPRFDPNARLAVGSPAPMLAELNWLQGEIKDLASLRGKRVAVAFVFFKNRACRETIKMLQSAAAADPNLAVVLINDATASADEIRQYLAAQKITLPAARVKTEEHAGWYSTIFLSWRVSSVPTVVIIDREGKVESVTTDIDNLRAAVAGGGK